LQQAQHPHRPVQQTQQLAQQTQQLVATAPQCMAPPPPQQEPDRPAAIAPPLSARAHAATPSATADGFAASDAADALNALAAAAWDMQEGGAAGGEAEEDGGPNWTPAGGEDAERGANNKLKRRLSAARLPAPGPGSGGAEARPAGRRQRAAKLWCRHPLDGSQWALVLSQSAIDSRNISLPWTNPGECVCVYWLVGGQFEVAICRLTLRGKLPQSASDCPNCLPSNQLLLPLLRCCRRHGGRAAGGGVGGGGTVQAPAGHPARLCGWVNHAARLAGGWGGSLRAPVKLSRCPAFAWCRACGPGQPRL
jgi:hypothetical protein